MDDFPIRGFSRYSKVERINALIRNYGLDDELGPWLHAFESTDQENQMILEELSENTLTSFHLPYSVAPNFVVNGQKMYFPLVTEESSVVAALANAASYWAERGGFRGEVKGTEKKGQVHFIWKGTAGNLQKLFPEIKEHLLTESNFLTQKMQQRGGGILSLELKEMSHVMANYYQIDASFGTCDAMGANFINSCLEQFSKSLEHILVTSEQLTLEERNCKIIMAILSNYTPNSLVKAWVECPLNELIKGSTEAENRAFAESFQQAIQISKTDFSKALTHNKGIFNGIDALAIATGNDFRAVEACGHAFASRIGGYSGLTDVTIVEDKFRFGIEIALATGVVGGVTSLHPLAKLSMRLLHNPSASDLMIYMAVAGLASNWAAVKALVSGGIQQGHMKLHLSNILNLMNIPLDKREEVEKYFADKPISLSSVEQYLNEHYS